MQKLQKIRNLLQGFIRSLQNARRRVRDTLISIYLAYVFRRLISLYLNRVLTAIWVYYRFRLFYVSATIIAVYWSYRLKMVWIGVHHFLTALETNEKLPGLMEKVRNFKRRASRERCSKMRITMDKIEKVKKKISSSWKELSEFINKNINEGLITVKDLELSMMRFEGKKKKRVYDYNKEVGLRELGKKYRNFPPFLIWECYGDKNIHTRTFFHINKYQKKIEKAKKNLCKVKSLEEEREIQKFIVLNEIAQADLELAMLVAHRISLLREVEAEFRVNREFMKCVIEIESILGLRLDIDTLLS